MKNKIVFIVAVLIIIVSLSLFLPKVIFHYSSRSIDSDSIKELSEIFFIDFKELKIRDVICEEIVYAEDPTVMGTEVYMFCDEAKYKCKSSVKMTNILPGHLREFPEKGIDINNLIPIKHAFGVYTRTNKNNSITEFRCSSYIYRLKENGKSGYLFYVAVPYKVTIDKQGTVLRPDEN